MFKQVGKWIKGVSKAVFVIGCIVGIAVDVLIGLLLQRSAGEDIGTVFLLGSIIWTIFSTWVLVALVYAFGEITQRVQSIDAHLECLCKAKGLSPKAENTKVQKAAERDGAGKLWAQSLPQGGVQASEEPMVCWRCPKCGEANIADVSYCWHCGTKKV